MKKISIVGIREMTRALGADMTRDIIEILNADTTAEQFQNDARFSENTKEMARLWGDTRSRAYPALLAVSDLLGAYGSENIDGRENDYDARYYGNSQLEYVNMGDTYSNTLMYDNERHEYTWGSWGDFIEKHPRRFPEVWRE